MNSTHDTLQIRDESNASAEEMGIRAKMKLRIVIVTPAPPGSRHGNRNTAQRWARHLRASGYRCDIALEWDGCPTDLMIALHARRSHASIVKWREAYPDWPLLLVLTGTDLYRDIRIDANAKQSMRLADRMVVLQEKGLDELNAKLRAKTCVVFQSVVGVKRQAPPKRFFLATVIGHLREEKDPFRACEALKHLSKDENIRVVHLGGAMSPDYERQAGSLMQSEPRYRWLGELDHAAAMRWLARSHVMVISSVMEGGAHVVSEAIAIGVPVIASNIPGNVGLLGDDYPGYFPVGDEKALAALLFRAREDHRWLQSLQSMVKKRQSLVAPRTERQVLKTLVTELIGRGREYL
ncbi:MAG: selenoneine biosynthesis selenosugar synthase SenB [Burkholderiales bacterium]